MIVTGTVRVRAPLLPVIRRSVEPVAAVFEAVKVSVVDVPLALEGLKDAVTPAGRPVTENDTAAENPAVRVIAIARVALDP